MRNRTDWAPKPCLRCGGPKPPGRGVKWCGCEQQPTLAELIADQAKELRMGRRIHRQRFPFPGGKARTLSLDALGAFESS